MARKHTKKKKELKLLHNQNKRCTKKKKMRWRWIEMSEIIYAQAGGKLEKKSNLNSPSLPSVAFECWTFHLAQCWRSQTRRHTATVGPGWKTKAETINSRPSNWKQSTNLPFDMHHLCRWMSPMSNRPKARNPIHLAGTETKSGKRNH